ncbi:MAG: prepilin-type N-terminal cleavage/methylation domain-containing protein [Planctomycetota bacterium]|nr:prepilin-type N-terminal cleavage/methylation domain-containing protein [Planctomycetota bacterium]
MRRAYTLVELLITITVLGIAAAVAVPMMGDSGVLRVQAAVRTLVADLTTAQSDAIALQRGRAVAFDVANNRWDVIAVRGTTLNATTDTLQTTTLGTNNSEFGGAVISNVDFAGGQILIFDEMGSPVTTPGGTTPADTGFVTIRGGGQLFRVNVEAYTGRIFIESSNE